jgi:hypothetical protein
MSTPFPNNVVEVLITQYQNLSMLSDVEIEDHGFLSQKKAVFSRPIRPTDPAASMGIFSLDWEPDEVEMTGIPNSEPVLATYRYGIQVLVKGGEAQSGLALHGLVSKSIRSMLYRDAGLRLALSQLNETSLGSLERYKKHGIRSQRFANNEIDGQFMFLSTAELWVQTETVPA